MKRLLLSFVILFISIQVFAQSIKYTLPKGSYLFEESGSVYREEELPLSEQGIKISKDEKLIYTFGNCYTTQIFLDYFHNTICLKDNKGNMHKAILEDLIRDNYNSTIHKEINGDYIPIYSYDVLKSNSSQFFYEKEPFWKNDWKTHAGEELYDCISVTKLKITDNYIEIVQYDSHNAVFLITDERQVENKIFLQLYMKEKGWLGYCAKNTFMDSFSDNNKYNMVLEKDGDYIKLYLISENEILLQEFAFVKNYDEIKENIVLIAKDLKADLSKVTWPRHADGSCDYNDSKSTNTVVSTNKTTTTAVTNVSPNKTMSVSENLKLRSGEATTTSVLTVMSAGTKVKTLELGKAETIDGINSNWVKVEVQNGAKDRDGKAIKAGTVGWCYGGYLK